MGRREHGEEAAGRGIGKGWIITGIIFLLIIIVIVVINTQFNIETIQVTGNIHYTESEIIERVVGSGYSRNTLILYLKNKLQPMEAIPFVEKVDVEYISNHVITITVYEKAMAGCVQFMNEYMYFDKDGIVLESSTERLEDIPCIEGIHFDEMIMYEPLPIDDKTFFNTVLSLTQLLQKYELPVDDVRFTSKNEIILYCNGIQILLGDGHNIEEQISELGNILKTIEGKKGTLYMKDYTISDGNVIFRENE
ncbi:MAG: FtsQ-type POTRA domain-containing protein [Lachnospiraceae bacterium]|nr:FtsQ-type POTRA domain-containing protein [Lachnospiraceae bacterium]